MLKQIYHSIVRSKVEYSFIMVDCKGNFVWRKLSVIQNTALRKILLLTTQTQSFQGLFQNTKILPTVVILALKPHLTLKQFVFKCARKKEETLVKMKGEISRNNK